MTSNAYGLNETINTGIFKNNDGTFTALTMSQSKDFKTLAGASKWLAARGYKANGSRIK